MVSKRNAFENGRLGYMEDRRIFQKTYQSQLMKHESYLLEPKVLTRINKSKANNFPFLTFYVGLLISFTRAWILQRGLTSSNFRSQTWTWKPFRGSVFRSEAKQTKEIKNLRTGISAIVKTHCWKNRQAHLLFLY